MNHRSETQPGSPPLPRARERQAARRGLLGPAAAALLGALLLFAQLREGVPRANDLADHAGTTLQVLNAFRDGVFDPRWMPDFHAGLGEPTLIFYPPGLYLLSASFAAMLGGDVLAGLFTTLFLFAVAGGLGIFVLVRRRFGVAAGLIACLAFALLPYRFFEIYCAGLYSAFCAACLLPWALHLLAEIGGAEPGRRPRFALAWPLLYALIVLFNLPTALFLAYFVFFALLLEIAAGGLRRALVWMPAGGVWGSALAGVYLVPALAEMRWVQVPAAGLDLYRSNFLFQFAGSWMGPGLRRTFAGMAIFPALGLLIALAVLAAVRPQDPDGDGRGRAAWIRVIALFGVLALFLSTPVSSWLWRLLPFLKEVNLPWRLLEPLGLSAAAAAAAAWALLRGKKDLRVLQAAVVLSLVVLAAVLAVFDFSISRVNGKRTRAEATAALPRFAAKSPLGLFLPKGARPPGELSSVPRLACSGPCRVRIRSWSPSGRELWVAAPRETTLAVRTYFFPGWVAQRLDGRRERLPIGAEPGTGRLVVRIPAGETRLLLRFGTTPARMAGDWLSVLALLAWLAAVVLARRKASIAA